MKISTAIKLAIPVALISANTQNVLAADAVELTETGLELTVTANRTPQAISNTLAPVSVITRNDIENIQAQDIVDVLRLQNGVDITRNGGAGSTTSVFLRGSNSKQVLVLIDGVRVSSGTSGQFDWSGLPLTQVERIEIVRGPRASLYGSDAVGGIIQIFTRKKSGSYVSGTLGKSGTSGLNLGFAENREKTNFALNVATESSKGFSATNERAGEFSFNPDLDGYSKQSINGSLSYKLSDNTKIGVGFFHSDNNADFDQGESDLEVNTISTYVSNKFSDKWNSKLTFNESVNDTVSASAFGTSTFETKRQEVNWQNDLNLSSTTDLILGLNYRKTEADVTGFNTYNDDINNKAIYANVLNKFGKVKLDVSARYDKHSQAGSEVTGNIATGYAFTPSTTAYVSYGTAFRAPNINDLYNPGSPSFADPEVFQFAGNPDLEPETSKSFEVGLKTNFGQNNRLSLSVFRTEVEDQIVFQGLNNQLINLDETLLKGIELAYSGNTERFDWGLGATIQRATDTTTNERLVRRPNNKFTANAGMKITPKTRAGLDLTVSSNRAENDFSTFPSTKTTLDSYSLLNLSLNHKVSKNVDLGLRVENATDEIYETARGYNTPRRGAFLTFSYRD